ncbi:MAG: hypothetical protein ACR2HN_06745 [Tepidiformaceae bacterium]
MIERELAAAQEREFAAYARKREYRMEWESIRKVERLERALKIARVRLSRVTGDVLSHA